MAKLRELKYLILNNILFVKKPIPPVTQQLLPANIISKLRDKGKIHMKFKQKIDMLRLR